LFPHTWLAQKNDQQCQSVNSTLFSTDVVGQVNITEVFKGQELNTEYIFCLFANFTPTPDLVSIIGVPMNYTIIHFTATDYIVSVNLIADLELAIIGTILPIEIDAFITFDSDQKVTQYDFTARRFERFFDTLIADAQPLLGTPDANTTRRRLSASFLTRGSALQLRRSAMALISNTALRLYVCHS
jgi:hypothetical protein